MNKSRSYEPHANRFVLETRSKYPSMIGELAVECFSYSSGSSLVTSNGKVLEL